MSKREPRIILEDILDCAGKILAYTKEMQYLEFLNDSKTREAVYRNFEVMGEAANRMPENFMDANPEIEWHKIISTRNRIIHSYDEIDDMIIWNIIQNTLPGLKTMLEDLLKKT